MLVRTEAMRKAAATASYQPNAVANAADTSFTRDGGFAGAADSNQLTAAFSVKLAGLGTHQYIFVGRQDSSETRHLVRVTDANVFTVFGRTSGSTVLASFDSSTALTTGVWYNVLISYDLANAANRHLYVNDADQLGTVATYTNGSVDFTVQNMNLFSNTEGVGGGSLADNALDGEIADLWFDYGRYVDFSVEANRRLFFSAGGCLVDKGADGSTPFGAAPIAFFGGANTASTWGTDNLGTGGDMTLVTGGLTNSGSPPCGA